MLNLYGFTYAYPCSYAEDGAVWGTVAPYYHPYWDGQLGHSPHFHAYKVCLWTSRVASGYETLTIRHELGHILSLGDDTDWDACLMADGTSMTTPCTSELNFVRNHYNRW